MTNEWAEFKDYTEKPQYVSVKKSDKTYMGRFTFDMIKDFVGFNRIFTILARGYLFHDKDGNALPDGPYDRIDYTYRALCAWSSVPDRCKNPDAKVDFRELSDEFPELVDEKGNGWYIRHMKNLFAFCNEHFELLTKPVQEIFDAVEKGYTKQWKDRVGHYTVPIFARNTKGAWGTRFDDVIAEALEAGALRAEEYVLPAEIKQKLDALEIRDKYKSTAEDLTAFYYANKHDDLDWVILPVANFNAYYRSTTFEKNYLPMLPKNVFIRETLDGLCRFKVVL
jgi:hypothetical protein